MCEYNDSHDEKVTEFDVYLPYEWRDVFPNVINYAYFTGNNVVGPFDESEFITPSEIAYMLLEARPAIYYKRHEDEAFLIPSKLSKIYQGLING